MKANYKLMIYFTDPPTCDSSALEGSLDEELYLDDLDESIDYEENSINSIESDLKVPVIGSDFLARKRRRRGSNLISSHRGHHLSSINYTPLPAEISQQNIIVEQESKFVSTDKSLLNHHVSYNLMENDYTLSDDTMIRKSLGKVVKVIPGKKVKLKCKVNSKPSNVTFNWSPFDSTVDVSKLTSSHDSHTNNGMTRTFFTNSSHTHSNKNFITLTDIKAHDYGIQSELTFIPIESRNKQSQIACWADNVIGKQQDPCIFTIVTLGKCYCFMYQVYREERIERKYQVIHT